MKTLEVTGAEAWWREAEAALAGEREIGIKRDGRVVARLVKAEDPKRFDPDGQRRCREEAIGKEVVVDALTLSVKDRDDRVRFDPEAHRRWLEDLWGDQEPIDSTPFLQADRDERNAG